MANSIIPGLLNGFRPGTSARTPGMLGMNDQGDPNRTTLLGDTPGPLGFNDWADPTLPRYGAGNPFARFVRTDQGVAVALAANGVMPEMNDSLARLITRAQLKQIFELASAADMDRVAAELNSDLVKYCLDTTLRRAHFFAQVREESGADLVSKPENLSYSPSGLVATFRYYQINPTESIADGYLKEVGEKKYRREANQEAIANKVYGRKNGNYDKESGDGWRYIGRGMIQLTGRENYAKMEKFYPKLYNTTVDFVSNPQSLVTFPFSVRSAVCFWIFHKLHILADLGSGPDDVDRITNVINSKSKSRNVRRDHFVKAFGAFN